jgi:hypothetical protein
MCSQSKRIRTGAHLQAIPETRARWLSSALLRRVVWYKFIDVSKVLAASIIRAIALIMEASTTIDISEVISASIIDKLLPDYTAQQPRRQPSS